MRAIAVFSTEASAKTIARTMVVSRIWLVVAGIDLDKRNVVVRMSEGEKPTTGEGMWSNETHVLRVQVSLYLMKKHTR